MRAAPQFGFPGLTDGDRWCLCALRWKEALNVGKAPPVVLDATHASAVEGGFGISREHLLEHSTRGSDRQQGKREGGGGENGARTAKPTAEL